MRAALAVTTILLIAGCARTPDTGNEAPPGADLNAYENPVPSATNATVNQAALEAPGLGDPQMGRCHGGECSWFQIVRRAVLREEASGKLYRLSVLGGTAADEENAETRWDAAPHDAFVFCSQRLPAVILPVDGALQVDLLDFVTGPTGPYESSANLYAATCHPGEDWSASRFAERFGYGAQDPDREIRLARPEDIFNFAQ